MFNEIHHEMLMKKIKCASLLPHNFHSMNSWYRNIFTSFIRYVQVCLHCCDHSERLEATSVSFRGGLSRWMVHPHYGIWCSC